MRRSRRPNAPPRKPPRRSRRCEATARQLELDPRELEKVEERLFALRALARKHQVAVADLPALARAHGGPAGARSKPAPKASSISLGPRPKRAPASSPPPKRSRAGARSAPRARLDAGGGGRAEAAAARQGAVPHRADAARRGGLGRARLRARAFRGRDQPRRGVRAAGAHRLGRRAVALHAGAEAGPRRHLLGADPDLRRGRQRDRRRRRGGGRRAAAAARHQSAGPGRHPFAAGRGARRAITGGSPRASPRARPSPASRSSTTTRDRRRSPACCPAATSPPRRAPRRRA